MLSRGKVLYSVFMCKFSARTIFLINDCEVPALLRVFLLKCLDWYNICWGWSMKISWNQLTCYSYTWDSGNQLQHTFWSEVDKLISDLFEKPMRREFRNRFIIDVKKYILSESRIVKQNVTWHTGMLHLLPIECPKVVGRIMILMIRRDDLNSFWKF